MFGGLLLSLQTMVGPLDGEDDTDSVAFTRLEIENVGFNVAEAVGATDGELLGEPVGMVGPFEGAIVATVGEKVGLRVGVLEGDAVALVGVVVGVCVGAREGDEVTAVGEWDGLAVDP